jgi:hypothetical protein
MKKVFKKAAQDKLDKSRDLLNPLEESDDSKYINQSMMKSWNRKGTVNNSNLSEMELKSMNTLVKK